MSYHDSRRSWSTLVLAVKSLLFERMTISTGMHVDFATPGEGTGVGDLRYFVEGLAGFVRKMMRLIPGVSTRHGHER